MGEKYAGGTATLTLEGDLAPYLFHQGTNYHAYEYLGCHMTQDAESGLLTYVFRTWAPRADSVSVFGDFTSWEGGIPMKRITPGGVWEAQHKSERPLDGDRYKYEVTSGTRRVMKADPYAFAGEQLPGTASVIKDISGYTWHDTEWMESRHRKIYGGIRARHYYPSPMNIYEMHLGSWHTRDDEPTEDGAHYLNYRDIADRLAPYLTEMGYTHVELMPVMEHPYDASWGYQICGYYAPTSRFGAPKDFKYFVDIMHKNGIGVMLDWVPAHFPKDEHGLYEFDGHPTYEYQGADRMENKGWGTRCFDVGREEVQSFLISNALFWFREYHIDGLRADAVASMLYLDYDRRDGEWIPNKYGENHNLEAEAFFRRLNTAVFAEFDDVLMIAEESTACEGVTHPVSHGGLGFSFKWNMGFSNDMFEYVRTDPIWRQYMHDKLTFPIMYAYRENFILPVSHDEVVHGKKSLVNKMYGEYNEKFAGMRAFLTFMMTMPGKKLLFMGTEFAQFREWDYAASLEWFMLSYPRHTEMQRYVKVLNHLYLNSPALWEADDSWDGFVWLEVSRREDNVVAYTRKSNHRGQLHVIVNFSPVLRENYPVRMKSAGFYKTVLDSDEHRFGGTNKAVGITYKTIAEKWNGSGKSDSAAVIRLTLPPYGALILKRVRSAGGGVNADAAEGDKY